jgi:hypothetical protein
LAGKISGETDIYTEQTDQFPKRFVSWIVWPLKSLMFPEVWDAAPVLTNNHQLCI